MQLQRFVIFAFSNALHLLLFNIFCLQLAPVPEKEPRLSTALTRVSVKEGEQGRAGDSEREDVCRKKMEKEVWYFTQVSGTDKGGRFKNANLAHARILVTFPTCHPQWSSEPQAHHKQVTLQKWRPSTPDRTRPITWRNTTKISIQTEQTKINTARKSRVGIKKKKIVENRKILYNFWKTNTWARRKKRKNPKKFKNQMHQMWEKPLKATCCQVLQSCCAASWRQRVKIQLVVGEKKSFVYGRAGCGEALTVEIAADFFFPFFSSPSQSLSLPFACGWSRKRGASKTEEEKEERGRAREREKGRERERGADHERTVKGRNALLMMK